MCKKVLGILGWMAFVFVDVLHHGLALTVALYLFSIGLCFVIRYFGQMRTAPPPPPKPSPRERLDAVRRLCEASPDHRAYLSDLLHQYPQCDAYDFNRCVLFYSDQHYTRDKRGREIKYFTYTPPPHRI
jgi:hypothetical protein